jgi:hypothetical protein
MSPEFDTDQVQRAIDRLRALGGLSQENAEALVEAVIAGAVDHAFELVNGSGPVPTAMTTSKADQLRWICERAGRLLSQREVEIVFRVTATSARSIVNSMLATYEESLREKFLDRMRADATVLPTGSSDVGLSWTLRFSESGTYDAAWSELARRALLPQCDGNAAARRIVIPRAVQFEGTAANPLELLGLEEPAAT